MNQSRMLLNKFVALKSKFLNLPDGEEIRVKFLYAEEVPNHFDGGKTTCIRYHLEVEGREMLWDRTSRELAQQMAKISEEDVIIIRRTGQKSKTKYYVRKV